MINNSDNCFYHVKDYSSNLLQILDGNVRVPATYMKVWDDGFGARGWKIDATIGDPVIIASTRETGKRIKTSVFIHDILDHFLSGFGVSGHRSEAMALIQLAKRTGSNPQPDYAQMVREDILGGIINGETMKSFFPAELNSKLPSDVEMTDKEIVMYLREKLGKEYLIDTLTRQFFVLGKAGEKHATESWITLGLNPEKRTEIGLALQNLLAEVDTLAEESGIEKLNVTITISNEKCSMNFPDSTVLNSRYNVFVD